MKAFTLPYSNSGPFHTQEQAANQLRTEESGANRKQQPTPTQYLIGALTEGLKQNFLGADIDMEFLTLTLQSYASSSVKAVRKIMSKASQSKNINPTSI